MKTRLNLMMPIVICGLLLLGTVTNAEEDIAALQYKLRSLQKLQSQGRYVNPAEIKRLKDQVERRADEIKKTNLRSEAIKDAKMPPSELDGLKDKATAFIKDNAYDYIKDKVDERKAELADKIKKAKSAREVAEYIENYTYSKDAPKNNPGLSKFYNDVYQEQGWIKRNLDRGIAEKQKKLDNLSRFDSIDQGLQKAQDLKEQAEKKFDEYQKILEGKIENKTGLDIATLKDKAGKYGKYYQQAKEMYNYVNDLKGRADAAGESVPDIPEAAKQGLRNMVYIGEALDKAAGKAPPGVSDMLEFYSNATKVSVKAAENAQKFKLGHGEIIDANQALGAYNDTLKQMGVDQASMTDFGKATGLRVIKADGGGYFVVGDDYKIINKKGLSEEQLKNMKNLYAGFEAVRKDGEKPLTAQEIAEALAQAENGKNVIIRGEDYGKNGRGLEWGREIAVEREMRKEAAGDLYEEIADDIPPSLWERLAGRDDEEYKRDLDRLVSRWSDYETDKLGDSRDELEAKIRAGLKDGKSFDDIMQDLNSEIEKRRAIEEEELRQKEADAEAEDSIDAGENGEDDSELADESDDDGEDEDLADEMEDESGADDEDTVDEEEEGKSDQDALDSDKDDSLTADNDGSDGMGESDQKSDDDGNADDDSLGKDDRSGSGRDVDDDQTGSPTGNDETDNDISDDESAGADAGDDSTDANVEDDGQKDDGLIHGAPSGDESDAYEEGDLVIDDDGTEYEKGPDGSWTKTGDRYDPITQEQKDAWDRELEDDRRKLRDQEASSDGSFTGSDDDSDEDGNIIDSYADNFQEKQKKKNDISADNMDLTQQIKSSSTAGDQQIYDAKKTVSAAGRDAKDIKDASAAKTAQKESDDSWGNTLGNAVSDGIQQGLDDFASTFGSEAADAATAQIFDGGKKKKPAPSGGGAIAGASSGSGGSGGAAPQPGGGTASSGGGSGGSPAGGGGAVAGGGNQGGTGNGADGADVDGDGTADGDDDASGQDDDFDKTGDSVTVKEDAAAGDGGGTANTGSSASGGFAKGHQDRTINGSGALAGKTVTGVTVKLNYQAYGIPDAFSIIYDGKNLGGSGMTSGSGTVSGKGAGSSSGVTIRVLSNQTDTGTQWNWSAEVTFHTK